MANTFELIASYTVGSGGASSISFTSIPNTWTDIVIKISTRTTGPDGVTGISMTLNSSALTSGKRVYGNGSATASDTSTFALLTSDAANTSNTFGNAEIYIPNYAGSANKSISVDNVSENNATTAFASLSALLWSNTAAITSVTFTPASSYNFVQYSTAYLYGVKNA